MFNKAIFFSIAFIVYSVAAQAKTDIRVLLAENKSEIPLEFQAPLTVRNADSGKVLWKGNSKRVLITPAGEFVRIGGKTLSLKTVVVESDAPITVAGRSYRGRFQIWNQGGEGEDKLTLVNVLDIEQYLRGTMKAEISPNWPPAALKAQAVAARSYALSRRQTSRAKSDRPYDLTSSVLSQVYAGVAGEDGRTDSAVADTSGEVLIGKDGTVLEALYHACCGGMTEAAEDVWGGESELTSVPCPYCTESPHYNWQAKVTGTEIVKAVFGKTGLSGAVSLEPASLSPTGRWQKIRVRYGSHSAVVRGVDFRRMMGVDRIRSTRFDVRVGSGHLNFSGKGWGHGAGLCQWGAKGMAGVNYKKILHFYYPSSRLVRR